MIVQEPIQATIWHCLNHYAYQNAIFLAERLNAEVDSDETIFLLATCYYRSGKPGQAYSLLRKKASLNAQSKFLLATCCLDLGKISEAEEIITGSNYSKPRSFEEIVTEFSEHACFVLLLYARICTETSQKTTAAEAYRKALKLNPFLWQAFEELCNIGEKPDPIRTFQISNLDNFSMCCGVNPIVNYINNSECDGSYRIHNTNTNISSIGNDLISSTPIQVLNCYNSLASGIRILNVDDSPLAYPLNSTFAENFSYLSSKGSTTKIRSTNNCLLSSSFGVLPLDSTNDSLQVAFLSPPSIVPHPILPESNDQKGLAKRVSSLRAHVGQLISRKDAPLQLSKPVFGPSGNVNNNSNIVTTQSSIATTAPRRSSRFMSNSYSVKENNKSPNRNKFATPKSPSRKTKARISKGNLNKASFNELNEKNRNEKEKSETITSTEGKLIYNQNLPYQVIQVQKQSAEGLMSLLKELGLAYLHLSQYNCKKTVDILNNISQSQLNTGWALSIMAKAKFELTDYEEAVRYFAKVRELEPYRCQYMELYSTALWHLQREVALSALAHSLLEQDRECAAAWCASGNCFSLQKEHDSAIKFFQRAIQVNPKFVYAYTLLGHEYVITEELDKALSCFRNAVRLDPRHYNAWYGIGTIFSKQERYHLAEVSYRKALSINSRSAVLLCHIGVVQHALQKSDLALETLNLAISNDPKNPLCKFHRASIYFSTGKYTEALKELEELKEMVPKESLVYYVTGKVHKKLGNTHLALMHFSWATDLDPKGTNNQIKEGIDPALSRTQAEEDMSATQADYPSDASTTVDPVVSSSQDAAEFVTLRTTESEESL